MNIKKEEEYPTWICSECAKNADAFMNDYHLAAFHMDICDVCNEWKNITEPRDYGYPDVKKVFIKEKVLKNLNDVKQQYLMQNQPQYADQIQNIINEINRY